MCCFFFFSKDQLSIFNRPGEAMAIPWNGGRGKGQKIVPGIRETNQLHNYSFIKGISRPWKTQRLLYKYRYDFKFMSVNPCWISLKCSYSKCLKMVTWCLERIVCALGSSRAHLSPIALMEEEVKVVDS